MTRRLVVVSQDAERRADWMATFIGDGRRVLGCAGPFERCVLVDGREICPALAGADLAVYDLAAVSTTFLARLFRAHPGVAIRLGRDQRGPDGRHRPALLAPNDALTRGDPIHIAPAVNAAGDAIAQTTDVGDPRD